MDQELSRRTALKGAGGVAVTGLLLSFISQTAQPAQAAELPALSSADFATLRSTWVDQLTGRREFIAGDRDFANALATLDHAAASAVATLDSSTARARIFTDLDLAAAGDLRYTYVRLSQMATAWATPGAASFGQGTLLKQIRAGLSDAHRLRYNDTTEEEGNWWAWEIGVPRALADTLVLLFDELDEDERAAYCAAIDHFVPDPWQQFPPSRGKITSVGANRVDLCQGIIVRSLVDGNEEKLHHAVAGLSEVWQYVTSGNGFFADGSFIQHSTTPYTGSYGVVLLSGLAKLFALLGGTDAAVSDPSRDILFKTVEDSFAPCLMAGAMADSVRGRSVSREENTGFDLGASTIEAVLLLARAVDAPTAKRWRRRALQWITDNDHAPILDGASVARTALLKELLSLGLSPAAPLAGHFLFPAMDRTMHRGPQWSLSTAMCSNRISWYECGNGENDRGYHSGSGMTYVHDADLGQYDDAFWATANHVRLPGTTVDTTSLPDRVEGQWGAGTPDNEWTGSSANEEIAAVGQHLIGPGGTGLSARKSWFVSEDVIVCLGSDIHTGSSAPVETIVDHRNLHQGSNALVTASGRVAAATDAESVLSSDRWVHLEGFGAYVALDEAPLHVLRERRSGSWSDVNAKGSTEVQKRNYATLYFDHGTSPEQAGYAYLIAPGASIQGAAKLARRKQHTVLRNDAVAQAVSFAHEKTLAATFWGQGTVADLELSGPACVVQREDGNRLQLSISEPTQGASSLSLTFRTRRRYRLLEGDRARLTRNADGSTTLEVDTRGLAGATVHLAVQAKGPRTFKPSGRQH